MLRILPLIFLLSLIIGSVFLFDSNRKLQAETSALNKSQTSLKSNLASVSGQLSELQSQDQIKVNKGLEAEIKNIHDTFLSASSVYESLTDARSRGIKTSDLDALFALSLSDLSQRNYATAGARIFDLKSKIQAEVAKIIVPPEAVVTAAPTSNTPPGSGFSRQMVNTDSGSFLVDMVAADMGSTKVIVDTASDSDCVNNCPVLPLADYVSRSGAYAGVNGSYFCPADYPSCSGKSGSFDLLVMNKNKHYFNSDNNVYSTNPVVAFQSGSMRFMGRGSDWGRDTGVDGVIMNYPLLISGHNVAVGTTGDGKQDSRGNRSFVANKGNIAYIGVVHNASVVESAKALAALGMDGALNLDDGGSTALWTGGYKVGPGRNLPNAVLFVRK